MPPGGIVTGPTVFRWRFWTFYCFSWFVVEFFRFLRVCSLFHQMIWCLRVFFWDLRVFFVIWVFFFMFFSGAFLENFFCSSSPSCKRLYFLVVARGGIVSSPVMLFEIRCCLLIMFYLLICLFLFLFLSSFFNRGDTHIQKERA